MKKLTILALAVVAFGSCNKETGEVTNPNTPVEVKFTQGAITRTAGNNWVQSDRIGITMTESGKYTTSEGMENIPYVAMQSAATSDFTPYGSTAIYYPQDASSVDFYAYYPYQQGMRNGNVEVDVRSGVVKDNDLLRAVAQGKSKYDRNVSFMFEHCLSQLTMNISRGQGIPTSSTISAEVEGSNVQIGYNIYDDTFDTPSAVYNIPVTIDGATATVILVPQTMGANAAVVFTVDGNEYRWSINGKIFEKGKNHTYDITITKSGVEVNGSTIEGWATGAGGSGTAQQ